MQAGAFGKVQKSETAAPQTGAMRDWLPMRWLILGSVLLVVPFFAAWEGWSYFRLATDGVEAQGVLSWKTWQGWRSRTYIVEYRFRDAEGRVHFGTQPGLGYPLYRSLRVGQPITVTYSRSNPDTNVAFPDVLRERVAAYSLVAALIAFCLGSAMWWWAYAERKTREHDAAIGQSPAPDEAPAQASS